MNNLFELTIHEAADKLQAGEVKSVELCQAFLTRIAKIENKIKAFVSLDKDAILAAAESADTRRANDDAKGRFDGIPIIVKDNFSVKNQPCGCASQMLNGYTAPYDATVISRLRDAGFIMFGRVNMDEFAMGSSTENSSVQTTANPWSLDCVPGGSSGGSAAAVAAQEGLAALGSDTGGSIRQPASFCGIVGLKPTYGRVSRFGLVAFASSLDQIGPMTKDVRDSALLLDLMAGHDPKDSTSLTAESGGFETCLADADISGMTIGLPKEYFEVDGLDSEVRKSIMDAVELYKKLGAKIVDVSLPNSKYAIATYYIIATAEASANLARFDSIKYGFRDKKAEAKGLMEMYCESRGHGFGVEVKRRILLGTYVLSSGYYDAYYLRAQKVRTLIRDDFDQAFAKCDIILSPTAPAPAFKTGEMKSPLEMYLADIYTISANLAGIPAISLPCGKSATGLPIGLQLLAPALEEKKLLQVATKFEEECKIGLPIIGD